jgi:hypothetical protein
VGRLLLLAGGAVVAAAQPDFRHATWGMTQAQVLATESGKPREMRDGRLRYESVRFAGLHARVLYFFANDKLVRAKYVFDTDHSDPTAFIVDFNSVQPRLTEQYGKADSERAFWSNDTLQDEPRSYLEQDRSTPQDILPSDKLVGLEVALGHLKLYGQWAGARTKIVHGLTGQNHRITHQVEFSSQL